MINQFFNAYRWVGYVALALLLSFLMFDRPALEHNPSFALFLIGAFVIWGYGDFFKFVLEGTAKWFVLLWNCWTDRALVKLILLELKKDRRNNDYLDYDSLVQWAYDSFMNYKFHLISD